MKLSGKALGLALGILWGATVFLATLWVTIKGGGQHLALLSKFYLGYSVSIVGSILGLLWGFVDGFVSAWVLAWLYNKFAPAAVGS